MKGRADTFSRRKLRRPLIRRPVYRYVSKDEISTEIAPCPGYMLLGTQRFSEKLVMASGDLNWNSDFIWGIADNVSFVEGSGSGDAMLRNVTYGNMKSD